MAAVAVSVAMLTSGCRKTPAAHGIASSGPTPPPMDALYMAAVGGVAPQAVTAGASRGSLPRTTGDAVAYLAYAYAMNLEVPAERLVGVVDAHVAACRAAGPHACQLIESRRHGDPARRIDAAVSLRAEPHWLQRFMQGVPRDVGAADGRVTGQSMSAEDLTREIVDTEATLRARRALRDRLQQLLATRPGSLSDLLGVERELARVQGELDSTESSLTAMRTRVAMSRLTLSYTSTVQAVGGITFEPLHVALRGFVGGVVESTAALITVVGGLLPWVAAATGVLWSLLAWRRRRTRRRALQALPVA